ncbi:MAG: hypothetical protein UIJ87_02740 [Anaerovoracaceae bacterium]|nr:hypothetical protein [Anaerovoracaceae bacterium]
MNVGMKKVSKSVTTWQLIGAFHCRDKNEQKMSMAASVGKLAYMKECASSHLRQAFKDRDRNAEKTLTITQE